MPPNATPEPASWSVVIPVKRFALAKSRFLAAPSVRRDLALGMLRDVVDACRQAELIRGVTVVSAEPTLPGVLAPGVELIQRERDFGINEDIEYAIRHARLLDPVAVLVADIPCATGRQLDAILERAQHEQRWFVPDADSSGTVMLGCLDPLRLSPRLGAGSAGTHAASGATELVDDNWRRLRRDVDTREHLRDALALGVAADTTAVAETLGLRNPS